MLLQLFSKLHVVFVHFPIALVLLALFAQLWSWARRKSGIDATSRFATILAAICSLLAIISGWFLAGEQEFFGQGAKIIFWHRWLGIALSIAVIIAAFFALIGSRWRLKFLTFCFVVSISVSSLLVALTAHLGGLLVHGEDYYEDLLPSVVSLLPENKLLEKVLPAALLKLSEPRASDEQTGKNEDKKISARSSVKLDADLPEPLKRDVSFTHDVMPIFKETCGRCHLDGKNKGKLRMDSKELLLEGGKSGPAIVVGDSKASLLVQLVAGADPDRIMPSKGRRLTQEEIATLRAWIDQGAHWQGKIKSDLIPKADFKLKKVELPAESVEVNPIDRLLEPYLKKQGLGFSESITDALFARRVYFDLIGLPPTAEQLDLFVKDAAPDKREKLVDSLLADRKNYSAHWMAFWNDLLRNGYTGPGFLHGGRKEVTRWLYTALFNNTPYNEFTKELVNPKRVAEGFTKGILWWENAEDGNPNEHPAMQAAQGIGQVFMGVNLKCASCHDSFVDSWKLDDSYGLANIYAKKALESYVCNSPTGDFAKPKFFIPELGEVTSETEQNYSNLVKEIKNKEPNKDRRKKLENRLQDQIRRERMASLASVITSPQNGRYARNIVNRYWGKVFGRALIEPVDELDHASWHPELLDWLAADFIANQYDLKYLLKKMVLSKAYQMPAVGGKAAEKEFTFTGPIVKRLAAEQLLDSLYTLGQNTPNLGLEELNRLVDLVRSNEYQSLEPDLAAGEAKVLYSSPVLGADDQVLEVEVDLKDVNQLWLVALPNHKVLSELERQDIEFKLVQLAEEEKSSLKSEAQHMDRKIMSNVAEVKSYEFERLAREDTIEIALWGEPRVAGAGGEVYLQSFDRIYSAARKDLIKDCNEEQCLLMGKPVNSALAAFPAAIFGFDISRLSFKPEKFTAKIGMQEKSTFEKHGYRFYLIGNVQPRAVFMHRSQLLEALGQPKREQSISVRSNLGSTMQALEFTNGAEINRLIDQVAFRLLQKRWENKDRLIAHIYSLMLAREPKEAEWQLIRSELKGDLISVEALSDVIWSLVVQPEFQLLQ